MSDKKNANSGEVATESSCGACLLPDDDKMVQCDQCDVWFHFACVGVAEEISETDWACTACTAEPTNKANEENLESENAGASQIAKGKQPYTAKVCEQFSISLENLNHSKRVAKRNKELELTRLEEERSAHMNFLNRKYDILRNYESSDESEGGSDSAIPQKAKGSLLKTHDKGKSEVMLQNKVYAEHASSKNEKCSQRNILMQNLSRTEFVGEDGLTSQQMSARQVVPRDLPNFSGKVEEWPLFISSYENSTRLCKFSDDENLLRLQRALRGKALEYVSSKLLIPALVPEIIATLRMVFGRPQHIINSLLNKLRACPNVNTNKLESLVSFALEVQNLTATMEAAGLKSHLNNPMLVQELIEKLPPQMRLDWSIFSRPHPDASLTTFSGWLFNLAGAASDVMPLPPCNVGVDEKRRTHRVGFHEERAEVGHDKIERKVVPKAPMCCYCYEAHNIAKCEKFLGLSFDEKWNTVRKCRLCRSCLKAHHSRNCRERKECAVNNCTAKHHSLLHKPCVQDASTCPAPPMVAMQFQKTSNVLYRVLPVTIYGNGKSIDIFAFLDDGSGPTLIEKGIVEKLQLRGNKRDLCLRWTDGTVRTEPASDDIELKISERGKGNALYNLRNVRSVTALDLPSQTLNMSELAQRFEHLKGVPADSYTDAVPSMIIGLNNRSVAMPLKFREGNEDEPAATKTRLGWTIYGVLNGNKPSEHLQLHLLHVCECDDDVALDKLLAQSMSVENDCYEKRSSAEIISEQNKQLQKSVSHDGEKYVVRLLWKSDSCLLPDNFAMALRRLQCFERKLGKDPMLENKVSEHIKEMVRKGYIRKLTHQEAIADHPRKWYLPMFVVKNANKPNKFRVVWDAAAVYKERSLNDHLEKGPDLLTSLIKVIFSFRVGRIAICGDICEMFHRVAVDKEDQQSQRFLWRNCDESRGPDVYVLQVLSFGASCSPSLAQFVKNQNATQFQKEFPRAVTSILERHYVDDMMDSVNTVEEAIALATQVKEIHKHANFQIRNWLSNSREVINALGEEGTADTFCSAGRSVEHTIEAEKVLGLWWHTASDMLIFNIRFTKANEEVLRGTRLPTKRELLRLMMSVFDPIGFLNCYMVNIKILFQQIWRSGIGWDEVIPEEFGAAWCQWLSFFPEVQGISVPRCYMQRDECGDQKVELHIFVDASLQAYAAVAYFRFIYGNNADVTLICSKAKVAPLRPVSIPRMELMAAVMGSRLGKTITEAHDMKIDSISYWTDSKTVLLWLKSDPRSYKPFVMFRVGEIQESTKIERWQYVPSKLNVADLSTKWSNKPDFNSSNVWFTGPEFLRQPKRDCFDCKPGVAEEVVSELRKEPNLVAAQISLAEPLIIPHRFSRWERMYRSMAYVKRLINKLKNSTLHSKENYQINLTSDELSWSQNFLCSLAQACVFSSEIKMLQSNPASRLPKSSPLSKLSPFIDCNSVIRMRSRLENALTIDEETKNPIIMPKNHRVTYLIVDWYHRKFKHLNHETVINEIFQKYHIPSLRRLLRQVRSNCQFCRNRQVLPQPPEMAPLPKARLSFNNRPFSFVGIDFFGPFLVTIGRRSEKRYGVVFTCLTCRAVHVEMAYSLSMNSCVVVIRNFIGRRGTPTHIYSDNGTNLKAAEKELREALLQVNFEALGAKFTSAETKWTFIPPASPHMGGAWERMVRSIKSVMYQIITPNTRLSDEKLSNLFIEVESIVNSRPLTYLSLDTADQEALTPNHFLLGSSSGLKPPGEFHFDDQFARSSWRHMQHLADKFWARWVKEFLPVLTRRTAWFQKVKPIEVGDVVIIADSNLPRYCWPKGVVVRTISSTDGQVRSAIIRTNQGEYHRPAAKIAVLDVHQRSDESV